MDSFDKASMAFHTSQALGFDRAHCIGNQLAAAELQNSATSQPVQPAVSLDETSAAQLQALDDAIRALLSIGTSSPGHQD